MRDLSRRDPDLPLKRARRRQTDAKDMESANVGRNSEFERIFNNRLAKNAIYDRVFMGNRLVFELFVVIKLSRKLLDQLLFFMFFVSYLS